LPVRQQVSFRGRGRHLARRNYDLQAHNLQARADSVRSLNYSEHHSRMADSSDRKVG
jgi:hypothetical protein